MARPKGSKNKPKGGGADGATASETVASSSEVRAAISAPKLKSLLKAKRGAKTDTGEINGRVVQMIAEAVEKHHLHRKAFGAIVHLDRMEPEKIRDYLDCFEHYLDISGIGKRAESVERLPLGDANETGGNDDEDDASEPAANVQQFPRQRAAE